MVRTIIGVMGPADASAVQVETAYALGQAIAREGWILLTGGRNVGIMDAACRGAKAAGGLTVGILPTATPRNISSGVDIPILTGLGNARNNLNVLSSQVVVAYGLGPGTASEVALALKSKRPVILLGADATTQKFFQGLSGQTVVCLDDIESVIQQIQTIVHLGSC
ncbi:cytochrome [filamentous cyanobacterium CCP5]|nr:cytochrome [filamentous cyanobacterium CCP5]